MNVLLPLCITLVFFYLAYRWYGGFIERVFDFDDRNPTPAHRSADSKDYVPCKWPVVFSHHFASIAGGGPIIGPALAVVYGFYPSWLWILFGAVFIGAVHDFTALFVSIRERGRTIAEVAHTTLGRAGYMLFIAFVLFMVVIVTAAFLGLTSTALSSLAPLKTLGLWEGQDILKTAVDPATGELKAKIGGVASTSVIVMTAFAPILGFMLFRRGLGMWAAGGVAVAVAFGAIAVGLRLPLSVGPEAWMIVISIYVFLAAGLPVWVVLQPRDFINSFILYAGIAALTAGLLAGGLKGMAMGFPAMNVAEGTAKLGPMWPMLFITVACGAISGFHSLIASGTTSKQISREAHAKRIGFGGMMLEGLLAVAVLLTISSTLGFGDYMDMVFPTEGRSNPILAFSLGMGRMLDVSLGVKPYIGTIFGILLVEGFLVTTLDTAVRLNRYLFEELWGVMFAEVPAILRSYAFNAGLSVALMFAFAYKQAFLSIWPVFGSANQLLAALALVTVSVWLMQRGKSAVFTALPAAFMVVTTVASLVYLLKEKYLPGGKGLLIGLSVALLVMSAGIVVIAWRSRSGAGAKAAAGAAEAAED